MSIIGINIGSTRLDMVETGRFRLDGGAMFGVVPKNLWNRTNPADEMNRITLALRTLLIRKGERIILVDTGVGDKLPGKLRSIYAVDHVRWTLSDGLRSLGLGPDQITDVIITHLHFDHVGGAVERRGNELQPAFANATYYVQKRQWEWALKGNERDRASYLPENYMPLREAGQLEQTDGDMELFPGIHLLMLDGHTFGQQIVRVVDGGESVLYCGDLIPTASHIPEPYIMGYDLQPIVTLTEKQNLLEKAAREEWILTFEHDPVTEASRVTKGEKFHQPKTPGTLKSLLISG